MMKFLTTALGGLTILAVTGMVTAPGQAMLGLRQPQAAAPVSVISDPGPQKFVAPAAAPTAPAVAPTAAPRPAIAAPAAPRPAAAPPVARPAPAATHAPVAAPAANPMGGLGGAGAITNILLNLPQVLQQGGGGE